MLGMREWYLWWPDGFPWMGLMMMSVEPIYGSAHALYFVLWWCGGIELYYQSQEYLTVKTPTLRTLVKHA